VGLTQLHRDHRDPAGALAEVAGVDAGGEAVGDDLREELRGRVDAGEGGVLVEVAVAQVVEDRAERRRRQPDVDDDVVRVQVGPSERGRRTWLRAAPGPGRTPRP
jgi:hypothetical protein